MLENRDEILKMDDAELSRLCELEFFKGTGNGGQKRNKTSSAARVRLAGTAYTAADCTERSQHRNRAAALAKLRIAVAFGERETPAQPRNVSNARSDTPDIRSGSPIFSTWRRRRNGSSKPSPRKSAARRVPW